MTDKALRIVAGVASSLNPGVLEAVTLNGKALAVWDRRQDAALTEWLEELVGRGLPPFRRVIHPDDAGPAMADYLAEVSPAPSPHRDALIGLVWQLAEVLARITPCPRLRLRIDVSQTQSCPRWHLDAVTARLICTLRGAGTEFGPVDGGPSPKTVNRIPTGAVAVFRGGLWPGEELSGILHRSPPLAQRDPARVVLVLDPITDEDEWE